MLTLLTTLIVFLSPVSASTSTPTKAWWEDFFTAEVIAALGIPLATAGTWLVRDYIAKDQEVGRARFKEEVITSLQCSLVSASKERDTLMALKLSPLENLIERLNSDLREGKISDHEVKLEVEELKETVTDIHTRLRILESNIESILSKLNSELSAILTAYIGEPVKVQLFMKTDFNPHNRDD